MRETFKLVVNGRRRSVEALPNMPLLWVLRDLLDVTGPKYGCGIGICGACTVLDATDEQSTVSVRSCTLPVDQAEGRSFTTIEGLDENAGHPVQRAWLEEDVAQCGYCQGGMILETVALLARDPVPDDGAIEEALYGVLCRCGTYDRARKAVHRAARLARGSKGGSRGE